MELTDLKNDKNIDTDPKDDIADKDLDTFDVHIGSRLRQRRHLLGYTQKDVANHLGIKYQQVQKYERGQNRIASSTLFNISKFLQIPVDFFFTGVEGSFEQTTNSSVGFAENDQTPFDGEDPMQKRETMNLIRAYYSIDDLKKRKHIYDLVRSMAELKDEE